MTPKELLEKLTEVETNLSGGPLHQKAALDELRNLLPDIRRELARLIKWKRVLEEEGF